MEVAPGTYVIHRPVSRDYPYVQSTPRRHVSPRPVTRRHVVRKHAADRQFDRPPCYSAAISAQQTIALQTELQRPNAL